ncbi:MAG: transglutaminase family protein [Dehalococcoidia bacterium]
MTIMEKYLASTYTIDCDEPSIKGKAAELTKNKSTEIDKAKAVFYFVRDRIKYNPYGGISPLEEYKASATLRRGNGYCVQKAVLLAALARAAGVPARLGFCNVRNHLLSKEILDGLRGDNVMKYHGYALLHLNGKWLKATPSFDIDLCRQHNFIPVDFDGTQDAVFHRYNQDGKLHMEYVHNHGIYDEVPWDEILASRDWLLKEK